MDHSKHEELGYDTHTSPSKLKHVQQVFFSHPLCTYLSSSSLSMGPVDVNKSRSRQKRCWTGQSTSKGNKEYTKWLRYNIIIYITTCKHPSWKWSIFALKHGFICIIIKNPWQFCRTYSFRWFPILLFLVHYLVSSYRSRKAIGYLGISVPISADLKKPYTKLIAFSISYTSHSFTMLIILSSFSHQQTRISSLSGHRRTLINVIFVHTPWQRQVKFSSLRLPCL